MYFANISELWAMDGHGPYVWSAYAIVLVVMVAAAWIPIRRHRLIARQVRRRMELDRAGVVGQAAGQSEE